MFCNVTILRIVVQLFIQTYLHAKDPGLDAKNYIFLPRTAFYHKRDARTRRCSKIKNSQYGAITEGKGAGKIYLPSFRQVEPALSLRGSYPVMALKKISSTY